MTNDFDTAVARVRGGEPVMRVARDLDIPFHQLYWRVRKAKIPLKRGRPREIVQGTRTAQALALIDAGVDLDDAAKQVGLLPYRIRNAVQRRAELAASRKTH